MNQGKNITIFALITFPYRHILRSGAPSMTRFCLSVRPSDRPSVRPSVRPSQNFNVDNISGTINARVMKLWSKVVYDKTFLTVYRNMTFKMTLNDPT